MEVGKAQCCTSPPPPEIRPHLSFMSPKKAGTIIHEIPTAKHFLVTLTNSSRREMHTLQVAAIFSPSPLRADKGRFLRRHFSATHRGGFDAYTGRGRVALSRVFTAASPLSPPLPPAAAAAEGKKSVMRI